MSTYVMNFGTFELGGAALVDHTTHVLEISHPDHENIALVVFRGPIAADKTLEDMVAGRIADEMVRLRGYTVLTNATVAWSGSAAHDVSSRWINEGRTVYGRQAHLAIDRTWVVFAMSAPYPSREACDGWFEEILGSFTPTGPA
jgi:hypothetical protein